VGWRALARLAAEALLARRTRTALTVLGIFVGVALITSLVGTSQGMANAIDEEFSQVGPTTIVVRSTTDLIEPHEIREVEGIQGVQSVVPVVSAQGEVTVAGEDQDVSVIGIEAGRLEEALQSYELDRGRELTNAGQTEVVVGTDLATAGGSSPPIGDVGDVFRLTVTQTQEDGERGEESGTYRIAGVSAPFGGSFLVDVDGGVLMHERAAQSLLGIGNDYNQLVVIAEDRAAVDPVAAELEQTFDDEANVLSVQQIASTIDSAVDALTVLVVFIAAVSLVVAGLGIANTMLVSVMERTREIGVLRALGFERSAVRWLFVLEAGLTGLIGGLTGVATGVGFTYVITAVLSPIGGGGPEGPGAPEEGPPGGGDPSGLDIAPALPAELLIGVVVFATVVSILAGLVPARKAADLDPVDALRSE
jgi:putative ABC transport system permease protein